MSDSDEPADPSKTTRSTPSSATKGRRKIDSSDDESDSDDSEDKKLSFRKRLQIANANRSFKADSSSDDDSDSSSDESAEAQRIRKRKASIEAANDGTTAWPGASTLAPPTKTRRSSRLQKKVEKVESYLEQRQRLLQIKMDSSSSSSEEEVEFVKAPKQVVPLAQGSILPCNHSIGMTFDQELASMDPITAEPLDKLHVDWHSPDRSLHMCYNFSTLKRIADSKGKWMQPPHFRTALSESLGAQIFRKFSVDTSRYRREDSGDNDSGGGAMYAPQFRTMLDSFFSRHMAGDFYVCPVCYHWLELQHLGSPLHDFRSDTRVQRALSRDGSSSTDPSGALSIARVVPDDYQSESSSSESEHPDVNPEKVKADSPPRAPAGLRPRSERQAKIRRELMEDDDDHGGVYRKSRAAQGGSESDSSSDAELNLEEAARAKEVRLQGELGFTDPMLVLSQFRATKVAKFCFKSQAELRDHLVFRHKLKTLPKAVTMRDFFQSYKIRAPDALVQRYLHRAFQKGLAPSKSLAGYWSGTTNGKPVDGDTYQLHMFRRTIFNELSYFIDRGGGADDEDDDSDYDDTVSPEGFSSEYFNFTSTLCKELLERFVEEEERPDDYEDTFIVGSNEDSEAEESEYELDEPVEEEKPRPLTRAERRARREIAKLSTAKSGGSASDRASDSDSSSSSEDEEWNEEAEKREVEATIKEAADETESVELSGLSRSQARQLRRERLFRERHKYRRSDWDFSEKSERAARSAAAEAIAPVVEKVVAKRDDETSSSSDSEDTTDAKNRRRRKVIESSSSSDDDDDGSDKTSKKYDARLRRLRKKKQKAEAALAAAERHAQEREQLAKQIQEAEREARIEARRLQALQASRSSSRRRVTSRFAARQEKMNKFRELMQGKREVAMPDIEIGQRISLDETVIDTGDGAEDSDSDIEQPETTEVQIEEHVKASIKESSVRAQMAKANFAARRARLEAKKKALRAAQQQSDSDSYSSEEEAEL